jgi:hypothetical protein
LPANTGDMCLPYSLRLRAHADLFRRRAKMGVRPFIWMGEVCVSCGGGGGCTRMQIKTQPACGGQLKQNLRMEKCNLSSRCGDQPLNRRSDRKTTAGRRIRLTCDISIPLLSEKFRRWKRDWLLPFGPFLSCTKLQWVSAQIWAMERHCYITSAVCGWHCNAWFGLNEPKSM